MKNMKRCFYKMDLHDNEKYTMEVNGKIQDESINNRTTLTINNEIRK